MECVSSYTGLKSTLKNNTLKSLTIVKWLSAQVDTAGYGQTRQLVRYNA